jgi:anti-sigma factor RsiW
MRCRTARQLMSLHIDGLLEPETQELFSQHIAGCARCRATWAAMQQAEEALLAASCAEPPPGLVRNILERLPDRRKAVITPTPVWTRAGILVTAAISVLLVGLSSAALLVGRSTNSEEWVRFEESGRNVIASGWSSLVVLFQAFAHMLQGLWQALRWPWIPLSVLIITVALVLWGWIWRAGRQKPPSASER